MNKEHLETSNNMLATSETCLRQDLVNDAYNMALSAHEGQFRISGEPYFTHCTEVQKIIKQEWQIDSIPLNCAALLHDTVEDTNTTIQEIYNAFGRETAELVEGVTKLNSTSETINVNKETLKKVLDKSYLNPQVALLKLADRLHNMRTLEYLPRKNQINKSKETLEVYTRLAESLGMWVVKTELEDLAYKYAEPEEYEITKRKIDGDPRMDLLFKTYVQTHLQQLLSESGINGSVEARINGYYNLKKKREKMSLLGRCNPKDFKEINDLINFRVKLPELKDCYLLLNDIHQAFGKIVDYERFDEFTGANKRVNGYSALQTTLNFNQGPVEIALTTNELEEFNNWGVISLIRRGQTDLKDYVLKLVFTPSGVVRFLPKDATGIDFAYSINPRLGAEAKSIIVNGQEMSPTAVVPNSSTVEVVVGRPRLAPSEEFANYCLPSTRKIINEQVRSKERDQLIRKGLEMMEDVLAPRGLLVLTDLGEQINPLLYRLGCQEANDLYFKFGGGYITTETLTEELDKESINKNTQGLTTIRVKGSDQPGILYEITSKINEYKRNIVNVDMKRNGNKYDIRLLVHNLDKEEENDLRNSLEDNKKFDSLAVV